MAVLAYFFVSFIACIIGGISGIGGGIIIKPVLDALGTFDLGTIGVLSSCTVLTMAVVSLWKSRGGAVKLDMGVIPFFAAGSILGGVLGKDLFNQLYLELNNPATAGAAQASLLIVLSLAVFFCVRYKAKLPAYHVTNRLVCAAIGGLLGCVASFLGIGGGPINIPVLAVVFGMDSKTTALNSIFIVLFSQAANLLSITVTTGFAAFDLAALPVMLIGAVAGGYIGGLLVRKMTNQDVDRFFSVVLLVIVGINGFNLIGYLA